MHTVMEPTRKLQTLARPNKSSDPDNVIPWLESPAACTLDRIALAVERIAGVLERHERREAARRWAAQEGNPSTKDDVREAPSTAAAA